MRSVFLLAVAALAAVPLAACGGGPNPPSPPAQPPQIACSEPLVVSTAVGLSQQVSYPPPVVTFGAAPVAVSCSPASGAAFPLGTTTVNCNAVDSQERRAGCSFDVTVRHRELSITKILAFGDSITEGKNGQSLDAFPIIDVANAYPTILQMLFTERISAQQITVVNAGLGGEWVTDRRTEDRLKDEIARARPEVLLLLEGINDINGGRDSTAVVEGLRVLVGTAKERGVPYVFVSTLLPTAPDVCTFPNPPEPPCRAANTPPNQPADVNQRIRPMVTEMGAALVDRYDEFVANRLAYIDVDGLHLRPEGNRALAEAFWDRIVQVIPARELFGTSR